MDISSFDDLLRAARAQPEPQRLLFVFTGAELPEGSTAVQRARFEAGQGGALAPLMAVDKSPEQLTTFAALVEESRTYALDWAIVFAAGLSGSSGKPPSNEETDEALKQMVESIKGGAVKAFLPFDPQGNALNLE